MVVIQPLSKGRAEEISRESVGIAGELQKKKKIVYNTIYNNRKVY